MLDQTAETALQGFTLAVAIFTAAVFLVQFFRLRREKAHSDQRLDRTKRDAQIKIARFLVRNAERTAEQPPADMLETAKRPTSEESGEDREPVASSWFRGRSAWKAHAEQRAWDDLRTMAEIYCAIPDEQSLQPARKLARAELDHRIADWNTKARAAYGVRAAAR